jgi:ribosomal 30S subunit maturation factor RimM
MDLNYFQNIGKLTKLHGIDGEAIVAGNVVFTKKIEKTEWVFLLLEGLPVPFSVLYIEIRDDSSFFIKLHDIDTADEMKKLIGSNVLIKNAGKRKSFKISDIPAKISGYKVNDTNNNTVGIAGEVLNYSGNYLLQILNNKK